MVTQRELKALISEFIGSFLLVFVSTWSFCAREAKQLSWLGVGLANTAITMALMYALISLSGAHLNPVVTFSKLALRSFQLRKTFLYLFCQLSGSFLAALVVIFMSPFEYPDREIGEIFFPQKSPFISDFQAFVVEFLLSALYMFVFSATIIDSRAPTSVFGFALGAVVLIGTLVAGPYTGGCVNPLRIFGPQLLADRLDNAWIYWVSTMFGGIFATFYYDFFLAKEEDIDLEEAKPAAKPLTAQ